MTLIKESILNGINQQIFEHLKSYPNLYKLHIDPGVIIISDMNYHKIEYKVFNDLFQFKVNLIYDNGMIKRTFSMYSEYENSNPLNDFFNHFISNQFDFSELFVSLNNAV